MPLVVEEVSLVHIHRTRTRLRHPVSEPSCAVCGSGFELISLAAAARFSRVDPSKLCEWYASSLGMGQEQLRLNTLVCLGCLSRSQLSRPEWHP
jgi:hypothetical protein